MIFSQIVTTTILHNINGLFRWYLNNDFIRKKFIGRIISNTNWLLKNILSVISFLLVILLIISLVISSSMNIYNLIIA